MGKMSERKKLSYLAGITDMRGYFYFNKEKSLFKILFYFSEKDRDVANKVRKELQDRFNIPSSIYEYRKEQLELVITNLSNIKRFLSLILPYSLKKAHIRKAKELGVEVEKKEIDVLSYLKAVVELMAFIRYKKKEGQYNIRINFTERENDLFENIKSLFEDLGFEVNVYTARRKRGNFKEKQLYIGRKKQVLKFLSIFNLEGWYGVNM